MTDFCLKTGFSRALALVGLAVLAACAAPAVPSGPLVLKDVEIARDSVWQGEVLIEGKVHFRKGVNLTILPGTDIRFVPRDLDRDGLGDSTLVVEGAFVALGTEEHPIRFRSASATPSEADWLEIRVDFSPDVRLSWCEISHSAHTLHAHFTRGVVEDCTIRGNMDGSRLGEANFVLRNNLIEHNSGKGVNFRNSRVELSANIIRHNGSGVFLFENSNRDIRVEGNNFHGNLENFRLGDFYTGDVNLGRNWWGSADAAQAVQTVYDRKVDPAIGAVFIEVAQAWLPDTGPRRTLSLKPLWDLETGGFIDASALAGPGRLYVGSWDGGLRALDSEGRLIWNASTGEVIDGVPIRTAGLVIGQNWGRKVFALDERDGSARWQFSYAPSPADDHRQGGLAAVKDLVLVPGWNGILYALDASTGALRWQFEGGLPLRSRPAVSGERIFLASGSGLLSALDLGGRLLWQVDLKAPLLSEPLVSEKGAGVLDREGKLSFFDLEGRLLWQTQLDGPCYYGAPVGHEGAVYVGTAAGTLWKLEADTGRVIWSRGGFAPIYSTPLAVQGLLVFGDNRGGLHLVGADSGDVLAEHQVAGAVQSTPLRLGERLVFGSREGRIHALELVRGQAH